MSLLRKIYYKSPVGFRFLLRRIWYLPYDALQSLSGKRSPMVPPKGKIFIGSGDFEAQGKKQLNYLKKFACLKPNMCLLDVGCGMGRTAVALTGYLDSEGSYFGFDAMKKGIDWCNLKIAKNYTQFHFQHIDVYNNLYNNSQRKSEEIYFPYGDNQFDIVFLFSVFSHMLPNEVAHYLKEIQRVLKPNGKCLATFFVYNEEEEELMKEKKTDMIFPFQKENYWLVDEAVAHANVAFDENLLKDIISNSNLKITNYTKGYWKDFSKKSDEFDYQDIMILEKK